MTQPNNNRQFVKLHSVIDFCRLRQKILALQHTAFPFQKFGSRQQRRQQQQSSSSYTYCTVTVHSQQPTKHHILSVLQLTVSLRSYPALNDSESCPSSLLKLLTQLPFIIDETLSAGYSNMQDLQTSVRMNKLPSPCMCHHLPLSWKACAIALPHATCSPWHLVIVQEAPWLKVCPPSQLCCWSTAGTLDRSSNHHQCSLYYFFQPGK